jgi:hypothetical protein
MEMPDAEWIKTLEDGRKVKFFYQELAEDGAFIEIVPSLVDVAGSRGTARYATWTC